MQMSELLLMGVEGLRVHRLRSVLTMLGIIFGVSAVIAMLSIGEGAKREALAKYKLLGVNNIIVRDKALSDKELEEVRAKFSKGLSLKDAEAIQKILPTVEYVAPQAELSTEAKFEDKATAATVVGVTQEYDKILNYVPNKGEFFTRDHHNRQLRVCVLGADVTQKLFPVEDPIGKKIKLGDVWFEVIGVMEPKSLFTETVGELASRNLNQDVYIPLFSFLRRYTKENSLASEIDQLTIRISESDKLLESAAIIRRVMERRHRENDDFDIVIPYELLKQEERETRIYNMVLGSIAAISLLVGGIGIMNIMLATVLERTREIGIRRSLGARRKEILYQFLIEAVGLSLFGGLVGIILGISMSFIINSFAEFSTVVTPISVIVAFGVSGGVGIVFGTFPAKNASNINPIEALRYE
ncbi:FtsX-like permease family protein [candidate division KSB1 bacterium]|nr:MAG: FtsX-like permease family protein [candidate division KSB1 bacterium]